MPTPGAERTSRINLSNKDSTVMAKLNDARRSLERAKESALGRLKQIEEERREIKSSVKSLNAALKALVNTKSSGGTENSDMSEEDVVATPPA